MKATTVKDTLIAARWILQHYGWCQNMAWQDKDGKSIMFTKNILEGKVSLGACCLSGAIGLVETDHPAIRDSTFDAVEKLTDGLYLTSWNDARGRTKKQVLALLDEMIQDRP